VTLGLSSERPFGLTLAVELHKSPLSFWEAGSLHPTSTTQLRLMGSHQQKEENWRAVSHHRDGSKMKGYVPNWSLV
jgi:hypothetical protein